MATKNLPQNHPGMTTDLVPATVEGEVLPSQDKIAERRLALLADLGTVRRCLQESAKLLDDGEISPKQAQEIAKEAGRTVADLQAELKRRAALEKRETATKPEPKRIRLTKSSVNALSVPRDRMAIVWDRDLTGLGLRISPSGRKTYFLQGRTKTGRAIKITLGRADRITTEQAREAARQHLATIELGGDPAAARKAGRKAERDRQKAVSVDQAWQDFAKAYLPGKRPKTVKGYTGWYVRHLQRVIGKTKLADLTRERVRQLHREVTASTGASTANRVLAVLSSLLSHAATEGLVAHNVASGAVQRHREDGRERNLTDVELRALIGHLAALPDPEARLCEFLLCTGARKGEVLAMRWADVDGPWWTIPAAVSKSKKLVRRPLNATAIEILAKIERRGGGGLVFQGTTESRMARWWQANRTALGMPDLRLHDLRHAAASLAINAGIPLASVGQMLGHGVHSASMTARYSHIADQQLTAAADAVSDRLRALRDAEPAGRA